MALPSPADICFVDCHQRIRFPFVKLLQGFAVELLYNPYSQYPPSTVALSPDIAFELD
jgi:hypothetical protein